MLFTSVVMIQIHISTLERFELRVSFLTQHWHRNLTSFRGQLLEKKVKNSASTLTSS